MYVSLDEGSDFEKDEDFQHSEQYSGGMPFGLKQRILEIPRHNISNRQDSGVIINIYPHNLLTNTFWCTWEHASGGYIPTKGI